MGLTIYYRGKLKETVKISQLLDEAIDICHEIGWRYDLIHRSNIMPAEGILFSLEKSEPVWLTFLPNGKMYNPTHFMFSRNPEEIEHVDEEEHKWNFTKTQYAGVEAHMAIIRVLKYLSEKYFEEFELRDESYYWETGDEVLCRKRFDEYNFIVDMMAKGLQSLGSVTEEEILSVAEEVQEMLMRRRAEEIN